MRRTRSAREAAVVGWRLAPSLEDAAASSATTSLSSPGTSSTSVGSIRKIVSVSTAATGRLADLVVIEDSGWGPEKALCDCSLADHMADGHLADHWTL